MSTTTQTNTPLEVVSTYHAAWTGGDLDAASDLLADDLVVHAPGYELVGKDAYREYLGGFMEIMTGHTPLAEVHDDEQVVLVYFPHTPVTKTVPVAERFTLSDGKIKEIYLLFDRQSYEPPSE
ncbi:nuclear transport factor 2 family protein [Naumannella halotolerans]|uniref:Ketosteroid isomerase-like protein n=1 Tax=Naumannella halotolerans TaxID=993414 RepID=A0A4R7IZ74_9ACTN|nr:nuclear transport factor 2 family protein [Naumannella halotolerans]TDT30102.1 ketosteroid isomerase-like protein [Naumannella halotolerans]